MAIEIESEFEARVDTPDFHGGEIKKVDKFKIDGPVKSHYLDDFGKSSGYKSCKS